MTNYKSIVKKLQKHYPDAGDVVILDKKGKILYCTEKWSVKGDIKGILSSWSGGNAQSVEMGGIRYSILQMEPERFIATNRHKKGHLIGATSPSGQYYMIAHIKSKAKGWFHLGYPAVARAVAMLEKNVDSKFMETDIKTEELTESSASQVESYQTKMVPPTVDSYLKSEIEGFLDWIKKEGGLTSFIYYALQQGDNYKISELAKLYYDLYGLFYD